MENSAKIRTTALNVRNSSCGLPNYAVIDTNL
jgi:hypothetical protein